MDRTAIEMILVQRRELNTVAEILDALPIATTTGNAIKKVLKDRLLDIGFTLNDIHKVLIKELEATDAKD